MLKITNISFIKDGLSKYYDCSILCPAINSCFDSALEQKYSTQIDETRPLVLLGM